MRLSERDLVEKIRQGDVLAYKIIFLRYYQTILHFLKALLKEEKIAEDIAQNSFIKLWSFRDRLAPAKSIKNYLYVLARNEALDYLRTLRKEPSEIPESQETGISADYKVIYLETRSEIQKIISQMPEQRRTIFIMSRYQNMTAAQIAEVMHLSVRTVQKHIELALKQLRRSMN